MLPAEGLAGTPEPIRVRPARWVNWASCAATAVKRIRGTALLEGYQEATENNDPPAAKQPAKGRALMERTPGSLALSTPRALGFL